MAAARPPVDGVDHESDVVPPVPGGVWVSVRLPASPGMLQTDAFPGAQSQPSATPSESPSPVLQAPAWQRPQAPQRPPSPITVTFTFDAAEEQPPIDAVTE